MKIQAFFFFKNNNSFLYTNLNSQKPKSVF